MHYLTKIDTERARQKLSMDRLADASGLSVGTLKRLFSGKEPNTAVESVCALCKALGISVAAVFATEVEVVISADKDDAMLFEAIRNKPAEVKKILFELLRHIAT